MQGRDDPPGRWVDHGQGIPMTTVGTVSSLRAAAGGGHLARAAPGQAAPAGQPGARAGGRGRRVPGGDGGSGDRDRRALAAGPTLIGRGSVPAEEIVLAICASAWGWRVAA